MQTSDREVAIRTYINIWLKDSTIYCHTCGAHYTELIRGCCEFPDYATNAEMTARVIRANKETRDWVDNDFASTKSKSLRLTARIPKKLMMDLEHYLSSQGKQNLPIEEFLPLEEKGYFRLFNEQYDDVWFAKHFPAFAVARRL